MKDFINALASKEPTPGGGGATAVVGSLAAALGSMVANLTTGKKKYAQYQEDVDRILVFLEEAIWDIHGYIEKDAEAFGPLAEAYKIPKEDPKRAEIMEKALLAAAVVPMELAGKVNDLIPVCSNCHSILHRRSPNPYLPEEVRNMLKRGCHESRNDARIEHGL